MDHRGCDRDSTDHCEEGSHADIVPSGHPRRSPGDRSLTESKHQPVRLVLYRRSTRVEEAAEIIEQARVTGSERTDEGVSEAAAVETDATDVVEAAGHFRIYLGAAAGVGKTYAMLNEGQRRRGRGSRRRRRVRRVPRAAADRGADRRPRGHPPEGGRLPGDRASRRWTSTRCCDDGPRSPSSTSLPTRTCRDPAGTANAGRMSWRLLDAGIDVITTVNIQHLESIADAVEQMTGARVRERVPDWVVRKANQIELVDSSPEQLRRRMLHGNIYPKEKVPQALTHFFRTDNLIALRELALRFLADETEEELLEHLRRHEVPGPVGDDRAHHGGRHRGAGDRRPAAPGGPHGIEGQGGTRRGPRQRRRRQPPGGPPSRSSSCESWRRTSAPAGTRYKMTIPPGPSPASPGSIRSLRS